MTDVTSNLFFAEAKSAKAVLPNAAAGAFAPMLPFESDISMSLSNLTRQRGSAIVTKDLMN